MEGAFKDLDEIRLQPTNVAATCGFCGHRGVLEGGKLWRWFALHRWNRTTDGIVEHMGCSICRRRPVEIVSTEEAATIDFGPQSEADWQDVAKRSGRRPKG